MNPDDLLRICNDGQPDKPRITFAGTQKAIEALRSVGKSARELGEALTMALKGAGMSMTDGGVSQEIGTVDEVRITTAEQARVEETREEFLRSLKRFRARHRKEEDE